jgi:hypothetical protein
MAQWGWEKGDLLVLVAKDATDTLVNFIPIALSAHCGYFLQKKNNILELNFSLCLGKIFQIRVLRDIANHFML